MPRSRAYFSSFSDDGSAISFSHESECVYAYRASEIVGKDGSVIADVGANKNAGGVRVSMRKEMLMHVLVRV